MGLTEIERMEGKLDTLSKLLDLEREERFRIAKSVLIGFTNGDWDGLKNREPKLHEFIRQATSR